MENFSFRKGWGLVKNKDQQEVKKRIMVSLNIATRSAWRDRLNGKVEPRVTEAQSIESIFGEYGITDVWGYETECKADPA